MARAIFVKAARKANAVAKKGESYYWWKFRYGGKHYSKTPPRPSQLTGSAFLSSVYSALEEIEDLDAKDGAEHCAEVIRSAADSINEAADETQGNLDNMPEGLQQGDTGQMMEQRISDAQELAGNLEQVADDLDDLVDAEPEEGESKEDAEERITQEVQEKVEEAQALSYDGE